ncbi:MAG: NADH:ubiquinone oxidoreductase subunit NDUFA12 [Xanthobacteraceae bacterium]|nr:NADH:ubiquinone oxidoreductase subunit NDUFA12 [Xanthobacteraceae bacterium]QYK46051.1 MAG: NADH:ubiquinone oxidoreductase subunit NDUFA12 [Xanthobacteraceae bacterium]
MKDFLLGIFTWWNSATWGTRLWTLLYGKYVGTDEQGNRYYRSGKVDPGYQFERRWVIYNGLAEPSRIGPDWHGWLHHTVDTPPTEENYQPKSWQKPHRPNYTGTPSAWRPRGSTLAQGKRPKATGDYKAWSPND